MAINVNDFAKAIRLSVTDIANLAVHPVVAVSGRESEFADATRLLAYCNEAIKRHAGANVPEAIRDMAIVQLGQYLYDAPVAELSRPQSALSNSGVKSILAPYRVHRAGVDVDAVVAGMPAGAGVDRDMVIAIVNELLPSWVEMPIVPIPIAKLSALPDWVRQTATAIPANKLGNAPGGATESQVALIVEALSRIANLESFETALRTAGSFKHPRLLFNIAIAQAAYRTSGNLQWPTDDSDQMITVSVNPTPSGTTATHTFDLTTLLALPSVLPATAMSNANAITFKPSDDSNTYYVGRNGNQILFTAENVGSYYVAFTDTEIDLASWARESDTGAIPLAKRPRNAGSVLVTTGTLTHVMPDENNVQKALEAIDDVIIVADDLHSTPNLTNAQLASTDAFLLDDASVTTGSELKEITVAELDKRYAAAGSTSAPSGPTTPTFTDEQQAVFDAFTGDDVWVDSTDVLVGNRIYSSIPGTVVGLALTLVYSDITPARVNAVVIVAVPLAKVPNVAKGLMRLTVFDTDAAYLEHVDSTGWVAGTSNTTYTFHAVTIPNIPAEGNIKVEEFDPTEINPDRVSNFYVPETWARQGNTDKIPKSKVNVLEQLATQRYSSVFGAAITSLNVDRRFGTGSSIVPFNPVLTLTSSDHGLLLVSVEWNVASDSTTRVALGDDVTGERTIAFHEIVALDDYAVASLNGLLVDAADVHAVSSGNRGAKQGAIGLYIGKTSTGEVGFFVNYDADSGATSVLQGNVQASIDVFSIPSGAPPAADDDGGTTYEVVKDWVNIPRVASQVANFLTLADWDKLLGNDVKYIRLEFRVYLRSHPITYQSSTEMASPPLKTGNIALTFSFNVGVSNQNVMTIFKGVGLPGDRHLAADFRGLGTAYSSVSNLGQIRLGIVK